MRALKSVLFPIHPEGYRFIAIFAVIAALLFLLADFLGWIGIILTLWCAWLHHAADAEAGDPVHHGHLNDWHAAIV